jgi:hypothetical protein
MEMKLLTRLGMLCVFLIITGCASMQPQSQLQEVPTPPGRMLQNGYSFVPLNEKGWLIADWNVFHLTLVKVGKHPDETVAIQALPFRLPAFKTNEELVRLVREGQAKDTDPQRFKIIKNEVVSYPMKVTACARSYFLAEDRAAVKRSTRSGNMILEVSTLTCAHPDDRSVGISIIYSQRYYPGQGDPDFKKKAEEIIKSVEFTRPQQPYFSDNQQSESALPNDHQQSGKVVPVSRLSILCSKIIGHISSKPSSQLPAQQTNLAEGKNADSVRKLASMGMSIERNDRDINVEGGSYALFEKNGNGDYSLVSVTTSYIEPKTDNQEALVISQDLGKIAPAFVSFRFSEPRQAFVCGTGEENLTRISATDRNAYNPCDSSLTSTNIGSSVLANTLLTVATFGANVVTGSTATFVDTDKEKVARLVVNSKLFECLTQAKHTPLKVEVSGAGME